jgi:hypothetical protein
MKRTCKHFLPVGIVVAALVGCKAPGNLPLSGGVQTVLLTPTGELARLPKQPLAIREPDGTETPITTDENGLAAFPLKGPDVEYLILTDVQAWRGVAQVIVYVVYQWVGSQLKATEVRR